MKKKIIAISCFLLFILIAFPNFQAQETIETPIFNNMSYAHVIVKGSGSTFMLASNFALGIGRCGYMRIRLEDNGQVLINPFLDPTNVTVLEGNHVVTLFGFFGYYRSADDITLNGMTLFVSWR